MAKRKSKKKKNQIKPEVKRSVVGVIVVALGVVSTFAVFGSAGIIGQWIAAALGVSFGIARYVVPFLIIGLGVLFLATPKDRSQLYLRVGALVAGSLCLMGLIHMTQFQTIEAGLAGAQSGAGGGFVGQALFYAFSKLLGYAGAVVVFVAGMGIAALVGLNQALHLDQVWQSIREAFDASFEAAPKGTGDSPVKPVQPMTRAEVDALMEDEPKQESRMFKQSAEEAAEQNESQDQAEEADKPAKPKTPDWMKEENFALPTVELLEPGNPDDGPKSGDLKKNAEIIQSTLATFGIEVEMGKVDVGPTVTRYMLRPSNGIKLSRITALQSDLALALAAQAIRIEAPIPGMSYVGVEIPNEKRATVRIRDILESREYTQSEAHLPLALGRDVMNKVISFPLEKMPHLLIAGATGAGKSMGLNAMILSMLYKNPPSRLKLLFVDPKRVELSTYNGIPHLLTPAIVNPDKAMNALNWCVTEMERRYEVLANAGSRNIFTYNEKVAKETAELSEGEEYEYESMPFIVVVIDELADLMTTHKKEVEAAIVRIAQMARAVGIHLILATQRPSTDVITGLIKANLPSRISFQVASQIDSRTVLDTMGAEKLLGRGDMLFIGGDLAKAQRVQGPFVPEQEVKAVVEWLKNQGENEYQEEITASSTPAGFGSGGGMDDPDARDELFDAAKEIVLASGKGSASLLQRRLRIGFSRAGRILDELEMAGVVGPAEGSKPREVYGDGHVDDTEEDI